jgi:hypothetical protein
MVEFSPMLQQPTPPTAYRIPFTTPTAREDRLVGIEAFVVHVFVFGS